MASRANFRRCLAPLALPVIAAGLAAAVAAAPFERGRLFRLERAGVPPSFVYGTIHSDDPRALVLDAPVRASLSTARTVAFELVPTRHDQALFYEAAQYPDERRLTDHVAAAELDRIALALGPRSPPAEVLVRLRPWAVLLLLAQRDAGPARTLDVQIADQARRQEAEVVSLELPDEQAAALERLPLASQLALMRWAIADRARHEADQERALRAWLAGDLAGLHALALAAGKRDPTLAPHLEALIRHLVTDRNPLFAHRLHLPLRRGRVFVAVGALHLYGARGLLAILQREGYRVVRVLRRRRADPGAVEWRGRVKPPDVEPRRSAYRVHARRAGRAQRRA
jgi:uncharacterized protein YbaP (TraB family)